MSVVATLIVAIVGIMGIGVVPAEIQVGMILDVIVKDLLFFLTRKFLNFVDMQEIAIGSSFALKFLRAVMLAWLLLEFIREFDDAMILGSDHAQ